MSFEFPVLGKTFLLIALETVLRRFLRFIGNRLQINSLIECSKRKGVSYKDDIREKVEAGGMAVNRFGNSLTSKGQPQSKLMVHKMSLGP